MDIFTERLWVERDMTPGDLLRCAQETAGHHCDQLGVNQAYLDEKGLFWAIIRNRLAIYRLPKAGEILRLETWPMPTSRTAYPRSVVAYGENGEMLFACHSLWILMDMESRAMVLPGKSGVEVAGITREGALPAPKSLSPVAEESAFYRTVCAPDIDKNRHMNNARYLDWVAQLIPAGTRLTGANLCYLNESREGQTLRVCCGEATDHALAVELRREKENGDFDRIFAARLEFDKVVL